MGIATQIMMSISGQDKTAGAFASVAGRAKAAEGALRRAIGAATAGLGAAMIARSAKQALDAMGTISDRAQQMGVSAVYAQQLAAALDQVGIKGVSMDTLADAFGKMTKETGATGAKGFEDTLASIAALGSEQERVEALFKSFGRGVGASFAPLVRQGPDALRQGLRDVMAGMPAVSDAAVNMGDATSDALKRSGLAASAAWRQTLGDIMAWIQQTFGVTPAEAVTVLTENVKWAVGAAWEYFRALGVNIGRIAAYFAEDFDGALKWMLRGVLDFTVAATKLLLAVPWNVGQVLGANIAEGLNSILTGESFDSAAVKDFVQTSVVPNLRKAGEAFVDSLKMRGNDQLKLEMPDGAALLEKRRDAVGTALRSIAAQAQLATGGVVEETAAEAVKAVKDAAKNTFVAAGTYEALKLALANRPGGAGAPGLAGLGASRAPGQPQGDGGGLMGSLVTVAKNIERRLTDMDGRLMRLEAV
jgi:hypothetical protein